MIDSCYALLERDLQAGRPLLIDGATGTELEHRGAAMHDGAWCAMATQTAPDVLREVHEDYIRAGARVITANTFSTNRNMLEPAGLGSQVATLNRRAVEIALEARERTGAVGRVAVAGSMSHQVPISGGTDQRAKRELPTPQTAAANFREMAEILAASGVDFLLLEMMSDPDLAGPAIEAALATGLPVWVGFSVRGDDNDQLRSYSCPQQLSAAQMFQQIALDGVGAAGIMHSNINVTTPALALLRQHWSGPLMAYPDSGFFKMPHWQFVDIIAPDELADHTQQWLSSGVQIIGGCCGLGVEHIKALAAMPALA